MKMFITKKKMKQCSEDLYEGELSIKDISDNMLYKMAKYIFIIKMRDISEYYSQWYNFTILKRWQQEVYIKENLQYLKG